MELEEAICSRRSIRRYRTDPVPLPLIHEIIELARHSPSSMNGQPWQFVVITDRERKRALATIKDKYCPVEKQQFKATMLAEAPVVIAVCVERDASHDRGIENGVLATAIILLAAHGRGLGSVYLSAYHNDEPRLAAGIRDILRLPAGLDPITLLPLGYPDETAAPKPLKSLELAIIQEQGKEPVPPGFAEILDRSQPAAESVVLRYLKAPLGQGADQDGMAPLLRRTTIREGLRTFPLMTYREVAIHVLDETSAMHTRSFKALDGCVTAAHCLERGYDRVVFESGGNTGNALTSYCTRAGIETFCFVPRANLELLDGRVFAHPHSHLIAVADRHLVKESAQCFARRRALPLVPAGEWRFEASRFRGYFLLETLLEQEPFDWFVQTISAAFGPIGVYRTLAAHAHELAGIPRFLGVQQEANCPMFTAWRQARGAPGPDPAPDQELLIKAMYDPKPQTYNTYQELEALLVASGGELATINARELRAFLQQKLEGRSVTELLAANHLVLSQRQGELVDKAGVVALAGLIKQIDLGAIARGSRVLCSISGGTHEGDGKAEAEALITDLAAADALYGGGLPRG